VYELWQFELGDHWPKMCTTTAPKGEQKHLAPPPEFSIRTIMQLWKDLLQGFESPWKRFSALWITMRVIIAINLLVCPSIPLPVNISIQLENKVARCGKHSSGSSINLFHPFSIFLWAFFWLLTKISNDFRPRCENALHFGQRMPEIITNRPRIVHQSLFVTPRGRNKQEAWSRLAATHRMPSGCQRN
jgi:hypothetical protein